MYGPYHPFFVCHMMLEEAFYREATREPRSAVVPTYPAVRRPRPARPRTPITWFVAPLVTALIGVTVVAAMQAVDPSGLSSPQGSQVSAKVVTTPPTRPTCGDPRDRVLSLMCWPTAETL
jgi:hypothetical protein